MSIQTTEGLVADSTIPALRPAGRKEKAPPTAKCKCGKRYRIFENYMSEQDMCPACEDELLAPSRERASRPEKQAAKNKLEDIAKAEAKKKQESMAETASVVAETLKSLGLVKAKA